MGGEEKKKENIGKEKKIEEKIKVLLRFTRLALSSGGEIMR